MIRPCALLIIVHASIIIIVISPIGKQVQLIGVLF